SRRRLNNRLQPTTRAMKPRRAGGAKNIRTIRRRLEMTSWKDKIVVRILLIIAKQFAETDELKKELQALANHISVGEMK
ncbi:MAG TPA: hypothetical protein VHQ21_17080, partial [Rhodanobacteraceae bacterium]|nr:hypothetical protein [Rhodanobacteraceae bacterium]